MFTFWLWGSFQEYHFLWILYTHMHLHIHTHKYMVIYICKSKYHWVITWWVLHRLLEILFFFSLASSQMSLYPLHYGFIQRWLAADQGRLQTKQPLSLPAAFEEVTLIRARAQRWKQPAQSHFSRAPPSGGVATPQHILFHSCLCKEAGMSSNMAAFRNAIWGFRRHLLPGLGLILTTGLTSRTSGLNFIRCQEVSPWAHIIRWNQARLVISNHFCPKNGHYILFNLI